ncbi:hypothetical protein ABIC83_002590 [Roseateles asaccharophilus]|uniref:hypothetical protein n=1 Tax=Roseateles asaccharophilus TaxID=582607 RepID=UPI0038352E1F
MQYDNPTEAAAAHKIPVEAVQWVRTGERDQATDTLFDLAFRLNMVGPDQRVAPINMHDLRRSMLMIESIPAGRVRLQEIRDFGGTSFHRHAMLGIIDQWDQLKASLEAEAPNWRSPDFWGGYPKLPKTVEALQRIVGTAQINSLAGLPPPVPRLGGALGMGYIELPTFNRGALGGSPLSARPEAPVMAAAAAEPRRAFKPS